MKEPIKVLFYSEKWTSGGIESFVMNLYRNLDSKKIKADILTSQNETDIYDEEIKRLGGRKTQTLDKKYSSPIIRTFKNFKNFKKEIRKENYDVIHLHICHGVAMIYAYFAKKEGITKVILHSHNTNVGRKHKRIKLIGHMIGKYLFEKYADAYFACSNLAAEWLYSKKLMNSGKIKIINNAIDTSKFIFDEEERKNYRNELKINDKFVVGHIGRFGEQKNHFYLLEIFKEIYNMEKESVLLLIGEGELKQDIINKAKEMGIIDNIIFYGLTKEVPKALWGMDVFVLPSLFEGKPVVGIETQAAALKTYMANTITKTVKISEYITYLKLEDKPKKWAEEIIKNAKSYPRKNMQEVMKNNGYDIKEVTKKMEEFYELLVRGGR